MDCGLHSCLYICGLRGGPFGLLDPYLCLKYRWSLPMPLPQQTSPRWEMLSQSSFFKTWKVLESCLAFGVCDTGRGTHFPRGTGTCIKRVGHMAGWEAPRLDTAENQGGSRKSWNLPEVLRWAHTAELLGLPLRACSRPTGRGNEPHREREVSYYLLFSE